MYRDRLKGWLQEVSLLMLKIKMLLPAGGGGGGGRGGGSHAEDGVLL